ncbi:MAG: alpha-2-macroglobulin family protein, partial [Desulfomonilaceae bacterium]
IAANNGTAIFAPNDFEFSGPGLKREINFRTEHTVVELRSHQFYPVDLSGISSVRCELKRIPAVLIPKVVQEIQQTPGYLNNDSESYRNASKSWEETLRTLRGNIKDNDLLSSEFHEDAEAFFAPEAAEKSVVFSAPLSFRKSPEKGGSWILKFSSPERPDVAPVTRLIQITNLAISYKQSDGTLLIWVTSLDGGQPVSGVSLGVVTRDGRIFDVGRTDKNGLALIRDNGKFSSFVLNPREKTVSSARGLVSEDASWLIASKKDDYCAIPVGTTFQIRPGFPVTEEASDQTDRSRSGYIFTDRGVYRPGDEVNFKFISRIFRDNKIEVPEHASVKTTITGPRGDVYYSREQELNEFGSCFDTLKIEIYWPVGNYTIKTLFSDDTAGQRSFTRDFSVQEYRESRHYVSLKFVHGQKPLPAYVGVKRQEEFLLTEVTASYFAGGPVRHGKVRWKAELAPVTHSMPGYEPFYFGNQDDKTSFLESGESVLDEQGKLSIAIPLDSRILTGIYGIRLSATVVDIDGQPATEVKFFNPTPRFLVGIASHPTEVQAGYSNPLHFILLDSEGKKVPKASVDAVILEKRYLNIKKRDPQGNITDSWEDGWIKTISTKLEVIDGNGTFQPELFDAGDYLVSITFTDATGSYTSQTLFKVGSEDYDQWLKGKKDESRGPNANILLALNQKGYMPNTPVEVTFHTPRAVKTCLLTLERAEIRDHQVIELNGHSGGAKFMVRNGYQPNVFVSLLAPVGRTDLPVYSSQTDVNMPAIFSGYANASVKSELKKLSLDINKGETELKAKPGAEVTLNLTISDQSGEGVVSEVAIWVVNEAVLAMTDFAIPDLSTLGKFDLPLLVKTGDLRLGLVSQDLFKTFTTRTLTGGGVGKALMGPSFRKDFRPVAYYNPAVVCDKSGRASVTFTAPDSLTTYRIIAVATDKSSGFVSADRPILVTKDFYVEPSLPRFMCSGDCASLPISVFNNTETKGSVTVDLNSSENLNVDPAQETLESSKHSSNTFNVNVKLLKPLKKTFLEISGIFDGPEGKITDAVRKSLSTRPLYPSVTQSTQGSFTSKSRIPVNFPGYIENRLSKGENPEGLKALLTLSLSDWSRIAPSFKYLMHYPYGCIEQISSSIIPLVGLRNLIASGQIPTLTTDNVDAYLKGGVDKILAAQQLTGGFSYWPGQLDTTLWASTYATFALIEAKKAGMMVPEPTLKSAAKFLKDSVFRNRPSNSQKNDIDLYWTVLALAELGATTPQDIQPFFSNYDELPSESKAVLILASRKIDYLNLRKAKDMTKKLSPQGDAHKASSFHSPWRELAACLMATLEVDGRSGKADELAGKLLRGFSPDGRWFSTADTGWCLLALSQYFKQKEMAAKQNKSMNLTVDSGDGESNRLSLAEASVSLELDPLSLIKTKAVDIQSDSDQLVNYSLSLSYPENPSAPSESTKGITLTKKIENLNGNSAIKTGDIVRISLEIGIEKRSNRQGYGIVEFLALEDFTPAGFVPINTELKTEGMEGETLEDDCSAQGRIFEFYPSYMEILDDGVRVFKNRAYGGHYKFSYLARATTAGTFWMRGSRISAMYDPDIHASIPGEKIEVIQANR